MSAAVGAGTERQRAVAVAQAAEASRHGVEGAGAARAAVTDRGETPSGGVVAADTAPAEDVARHAAAGRARPDAAAGPGETVSADTADDASAVRRAATHDDVAAGAPADDADDGAAPRPAARNAVGAGPPWSSAGRVNAASVPAAAGGGASPATVTAVAARPWASSRALHGLFALALIFFVKESQPLLAPIVFAVVLTFVLAPFVRALRRRGVPEALGAALMVVALLGGVGLLAASVAEPAALWWQRAPSTVAQLLAQLDRLRSAIPGLGPPAPPTASQTALPTPPQARHGPPSAGRGASSPAGDATPAGRSEAPLPPALPPPADPLKDRLASEGFALTGLLLGRSASFAVAAAATVILLFFLLASEHWLLSRCVEAVPRRRTRALVLGGIRAAQRDIGRYLLAVTILNAGAGLATGLAVHALGLPNPVLWGALTAVLCFVPYIGPLVIVLALLSAGVATFTGEAAMLAPAAAFIAVHAIETNLVSPWVIGRRLALSPVSVFLSVMLWGWMWGIAGALVAVPLLIGLRCVCRRNRRLRLVSIFLEGDHLRPPPTLPSLLRVRRRPPHDAP